MFDSILVMALLVDLAGAQASKSTRTCPGVEVTLRVMPTTFRQGTQPRFAVVLKNVLGKPVRLLEIRDGRRPDLAHSYYEIIFEQNARTLKDLPRAISDPGPIDAADFFELSPDAIVEAPLTTPADLSALASGYYSAHVRITLDPFGQRILRCHSTRTTFTVSQ